jgi:hypothetical protein
MLAEGGIGLVQLMATCISGTCRPATTHKSAGRRLIGPRSVLASARLCDYGGRAHRSRHGSHIFKQSLH